LIVLIFAVAVATQPRSAVAFAQDRLGSLTTVDPASTSVIALIVAVVAFVVLLAEVWPRWHRHVFEARIDGGIVEYSSGVVADAIRHALATEDGSRECQVEIGGSGSRVQARVQMRLDPGADPQIVGSRLAGLVRDRIKSLGLTPNGLRLVIESPTESYEAAIRPASNAA